METKKYTLPVTKKEFEVKTYITGRDSEYIQEPLLNSMNMSFNSTSKDVSLGKMEGKAVVEMQKREFESYLASLDGNKENVRERALDLPQKDYEFIKERIEEAKEEDEKKVEARTQNA